MSYQTKKGRFAVPLWKLELVTGGQRLHQHHDYLAVLKVATQEAPAGYLDSLCYAMPPYGGFAIGLRRWLARLTGAANIRQVTTFPRKSNA